MTARLRSVLAAVLLVLTVVLVPLAVTSVWVRTSFTETDRYVATVAPLATDPAVTTLVEARLTDLVMEKVAEQQLLQRASEALEAQGVPKALAQALTLLSEPLGGRLEAVVRRAVTRVVESPAFATVWTEANRVAHTQLIAVLSQDQTGVLVSNGQSLDIDVGNAVDKIQEALVTANVPLADKIPAVDASIPIATTDDLAKAHTAYVLLRASAIVLPVLALLLLVGGVLLARNRRRAFIVTALGVAGLTVVLLLVLSVLRSHMTEQLKPEGQAAAGSVLGAVVGPLRVDLRWLVVVAVLLAVAVAFVGPSAGAVRARGSVVHSVAGGRTWVRSHAWVRPVAAVVALLAVLAVVLADDLGVPLTLVLCIVAVVAGLAVALGASDEAADVPGGTGSDGGRDTADVPAPRQGAVTSAAPAPAGSATAPAAGSESPRPGPDDAARG